MVESKKNSYIPQNFSDILEIEEVRDFFKNEIFNKVYVILEKRKLIDYTNYFFKLAVKIMVDSDNLVGIFLEPNKTIGEKNKIINEQIAIMYQNLFEIYDGLGIPIVMDNGKKSKRR